MTRAGLTCPSFQNTCRFICPILGRKIIDFITVVISYRHINSIYYNYLSYKKGELLFKKKKKKLTNVVCNVEADIREHCWHVCVCLCARVCFICISLFKFHLLYFHATNPKMSEPALMHSRRKTKEINVISFKRASYSDRGRFVQ